MKKTVVATMALLLMSAAVSAAALAAPGGLLPGGGSHRIHVNPGARMQTPVQNRVRMTPIHRVSGPAGGRMSSYRPAPVMHRVIVRPSLPLPLRWRRSGYYSGHYWRPYGYGTVVVGDLAGWYGYPAVYPVVYPAGYYVRPYYGYGPAVRVRVRL